MPVNIEVSSDGMLGTDISYSGLILAGQSWSGSEAISSCVTQIYEGTNQIQRIVMAKHLLKRAG